MIQIDLTGKTALVTGASQGLGAAMARKLSEAGATVVINYFEDASGKNAALAQAVANDCPRAIALPGDVRSLEEVSSMIDRVLQEYSTLDILVNNAGIVRDSTLRKMDAEQWQSVIDTNLTGVFNTCHAAVDKMNEGGRIINISSVSAMMGAFGQSNYVAAKAGVIGLTKTLSRELAKRQITVNSIAPGMVLTEMGKTVPEEVRENW
ncbi:MAG: SDR family NAD(P)-dependent oxidoreductase, partial [Opitutaceae bacterium]|nr:SDR family NAD(P)-dependent oxidoreductase [Opitutaceae bacterium]